MSWRFLWDTQVETDEASGHVGLCLGEVSGLETEILGIVSREGRTVAREVGGKPGVTTSRGHGTFLKEGGQHCHRLPRGCFSK